MKHFIYILLIFLTSITACQQRTAYPLAIQQAEALMNTRPDSALTLLESTTDSLAMLPEEARMYHSLLTIQAKDKLYITPPATRSSTASYHSMKTMATATA